MNDNLVLVMELAVGQGTIALWNGEEQLLELRPDDSANRSEDILVHIDSMFASTGYSLADLRALVCARGPGGYTGIRVGLATAKALARATGIKAYGYSVVDSLLLDAGESGDAVCIIDAGRKEYLVGTPEGIRIVNRDDLKGDLKEAGVDTIVTAVRDLAALSGAVNGLSVTIKDASDNVGRNLFHLYCRTRGEGSLLSPIYGRSFG